MESINEEHLDIATLDPKKIISFNKWVVNENKKFKHTLVGHLSADGTGYHKYCSYNKFSKQILAIPSSDDGWLNNVESARYDYQEDDNGEKTFEEYLEYSQKFFMTWIDQHICNPDVKYFETKKESCVDKHKNCDLYKTLDNYSIGFVVLIGRGNNDTYVYGMTRDVLPDNYNGDETILFDMLIAKYVPLDIFIGRSIFNEMTDFSGGYGEKWNGNSILLRIGHFNEYRYVHVGIRVFEFVVDEKITKYVSSVGNNCVPYPYAESKNWVYDMCRQQRFPISDNLNRAVKGHVYDSDNTNAHKIEIVHIASRGIKYMRSSINCNEPATYILLDSPFELCANTCDDEKLSSVQHINKVLTNDEENVYCASLQDKLPPSTDTVIPTTSSYGCIIL
jgi:hypothetical protein